jgi:RNA recognition motif-containing protein
VTFDEASFRTGKANILGARLFVDNLPPGTTEEVLHALFSQDGRTVLKVAIMVERQSGDSHGYAFVEMASGADAAQATLALHGFHLQGRPLHVSAARPRGGSSKAGRDR